MAHWSVLLDCLRCVLVRATGILRFALAPGSDDDRSPSRDRYELRTHDDRGDRPARRLGRPANEASGRPGLASSSGRAAERRQLAWSNVILAGRAPDVPYASVRSGHPRTTTVYAHALRTGGSAHTEWAEGASQARGEAFSTSRPADGPDSECPRCPHGMSARTLIGQGVHPPVRVSVRT
jgi:hypothetical protein